MAIIALACVLPFLYILSASLKESQLLFQYPPDWVPIPPYFGNYQRLLFDNAVPALDAQHAHCGVGGDGDQGRHRLDGRLRVREAGIPGQDVLFLLDASPR